MHAIYTVIQKIHAYTKMNLSTVKWAQWDKTQSRELLVLFICVCSSLCTVIAHNTAQNRPDNFPSYPPDDHHCSSFNATVTLRKYLLLLYLPSHHSLCSRCYCNLSCRCVLWFRWGISSAWVISGAGSSAGHCAEAARGHANDGTWRYAENCRARSG